MILGIATDSQDATGKVVDERPVPMVSDADLHALAAKFTGALTQVPPMFSALKKDGVRLYRLARQGKEVPREPRSIYVEALNLRRRSVLEIEFEVTCSRGTYVRTLAADMGAELGCGAHLKILRRTACGPLTIEHAVTLDELERRGATASMVSLAVALGHLRAAQWSSRLISRLRLGQQDLLAQIGQPQEGERLARVLNPRGELAALAQWIDDPLGGRWRLLRVFQE